MHVKLGFQERDTICIFTSLWKLTFSNVIRVDLAKSRDACEHSAAIRDTSFRVEYKAPRRVSRCQSETSRFHVSQRNMTE